MSSPVSNLNQYLLMVKNRDGHKANQDKADRVQQRGDGKIVDRHEYPEEEVSPQVQFLSTHMDWYCTQSSTEYFSEHICCDGVGPKDQPDVCPTPLPLLDFDRPITNRQACDTATCGEQHEGTAPQILVDGKPCVPDQPQTNGSDTRDHHPERFL